MTPLSDLLSDACRRELVLVTDVIDRTHIVRMPHVADAATDLSRADCQQVMGLIDAGLVQLGDVAVLVPWYGGETAHGYRLLPTEHGLALADDQLVELPHITSHAIARGGGMNWRNDALCRPGSGIDPELFWTIGDERSKDPATIAQIAQAKAVCSACPVQSACLADAYDTHEFQGIRAGTTGAEREDTTKRTKRTVPAAEVLLAPVTPRVEVDPEAQFEVQTDWEIRRESMTPDELAAHRATRSASTRRTRNRQQDPAEVAS